MTANLVAVDADTWCIQFISLRKRLRTSFLRRCGKSVCCQRKKARSATEAVLHRVVAYMGVRIVLEHTPKHSSASNLAATVVKQLEEQACVFFFFETRSGHAPWHARDSKLLFSGLGAGMRIDRLRRLWTESWRTIVFTIVHVTCRIEETWYDSVTQVCSAFLILTIGMRRGLRCRRVKPSGDEPSGLEQMRNPTNSCWIVFALPGDWRRKTNVFARYCSLLREFWAPSHEMRGRPPTQPDLLVDVTTVPLVVKNRQWRIRV